MDSQARKQLTDHLEMLDVIVLSHERRTEIMDLVSRASTVEEAQGAIVELLGVPFKGAQAILEQQVYRFTHDERDMLVARRDEVRLQLQAVPD